jgi:hypothetical protein
VKFSGQLSIGNCVQLTNKGAAEHRQHHAKQAVVGAAAITAATGGLAAPAVLGGAVGVAGAFGAVGVGTGAAGAAAGGAAGAAAGGVAAAFGGGPEAGMIGKIIDKKGRWFGQSGHDYEVRWEDGTKSWHLSKHLDRLADEGTGTPA